MKKILVPTDFSDNSKNASDYGIALFDSKETIFIFLNTFYVPYTADEVAYSYDDVIRQNAEQLFETEKKRISKRFPKLEGKLESYFQVGDVVSVASSFIHREKIDYVVMGTKGASGLSEVLVGSRTASMIKKIDIPLVVVPENAKFKEPQTILFTTDKELQSEDLNIDILVDIAKRFNSNIRGLYVSKTGENLNIETTFIKYDLNLKLADVKHDLDVDINRNPAEAIENYTLKYPVDMVAMISTKGNLFHEIFHKSVTRRIAMHTEIPMLVMHAKI